MKYKNCLLITGGAGFIGSAFLRKLVPEYPDWLFVNLDLLTYAGDLKKVESISNSLNYLFIHGDICDKKLVEEIFDKYKVNWVINFAAESHVDNSIVNSKSFIDTNILGTHTLLDVARLSWDLNFDSKPHNKYLFIQISTDEIYGSLGSSDKSSVEEDSLLPNSPYSASKASSELLCRSYYKTYKLPIIISRSSNNYGPFQNKEKFIPTVINSLLSSKSIPVYGDGKNIREWIYVDDNTDAIVEILHKGVVGEIYNIGSGNEVTNLKMIDTISELIGISDVNLNFVSDRLGHDYRYSLNIERIKSLGWSATTDLETGLKLTIKYYRDHF
jgi:dTDP-glucose 4,6-dehydratase